MRILSWNLNHRAARRPIPTWIAEAIAAQAPDVLALNEYVDARDTPARQDDHERFLRDLDTMGLTHRLVTTRVGRSNQVLVAAREPIEAGSLVATDDISDSLPPNLWHVRLVETGQDLVAFRMPAYEYANRHKKRLTWDWLIDALGVIRGRPAVLIGDMNTEPGDSERYCGDSLEKLAASGWTLVVPTSGYSWRWREGSPERRIDLAFHTPKLRCQRAAYAWDFHALDERASKAPVGLPDHAMLLVEMVPT